MQSPAQPGLHMGLTQVGLRRVFEFHVRRFGGLLLCPLLTPCSLLVVDMFRRSPRSTGPHSSDTNSLHLLVLLVLLVDISIASLFVCVHGPCPTCPAIHVQRALEPCYPAHTPCHQSDSLTMVEGLRLILNQQIMIFSFIFPRSLVTPDLWFT